MSNRGAAMMRKMVRKTLRKNHDEVMSEIIAMSTWNRIAIALQILFKVKPQ